MTGDQSCDLANGASAHQAGRRKGNANSQLERAFNLDSHQRIEAEVCERLVVPQTVGFHSQNSADNFAHGLCDDSFLSAAATASILIRQSLVAPLVSWLWIEAKTRLNSRLSCSPRKNVPHFAQSTRTAATCGVPARNEDSRMDITS